jgi:hypothetical protein
MKLYSKLRGVDIMWDNRHEIVYPSGSYNITIMVCKLGAPKHFGCQNERDKLNMTFIGNRFLLKSYNKIRFIR